MAAEKAEQSEREEILPAVRNFLERGPKCLIGGEFVPAKSGKTFKTEDPSTGKPLADIPQGGAEDIDAAVRAAREALEGKAWAKMSVMQRSQLLWRLAELIDKNAAELAQLETLDTGKAIRESEGIDIPGAAHWFRYYSGAATRILGETFPMTVPGDWHAFTYREPVGVVGAIIPWNFPLVVASWKLAPALACGCTIVLKPAEETPLTCLKLAELVMEAGFPPGVVNVVTGFGEEAGAPLAAHPGVEKITFTGSTEVGRKIVAASQGNFKRLTLELGGKSAHIICPDADADTATKVAARAGIFRNQGQICSAGSRILAHKSVYDGIVDSMAGHAKAVKVGPGMARDTQMGPVVSKSQYDRVLDYIRIGKDQDKATVAAGGNRVEGMAEGYFVEPTVFGAATNDMVISQEEIFGPVATVIPFEDEEDAVRIANATSYGLAAGIWTNDLKRAHRMVKAIRAGTIWVNTYNMIDATTPWGGFGQSGLGREHGQAAIDYFTELKTGVFSLR